MRLFEVNEENFYCIKSRFLAASFDHIFFTSESLQLCWAD